MGALLVDAVFALTAGWNGRSDCNRHRLLHREGRRNLQSAAALKCKETINSV